MESYNMMLQYRSSKKLSLQSRKIDKYQYLTIEEKLPSKRTN